MIKDYYPKHSDPRLTEDLRLLFDGLYELQGSAERAHARIGELQKPSAKSPSPGGPSSTKIGGLNVRGIPPTSGASVATLSKIPVLGYDATTGEITWFIPA